MINQWSWPEILMRIYFLKEDQIRIMITCVNINLYSTSICPQIKEVDLVLITYTHVIWQLTKPPCIFATLATIHGWLQMFGCDIFQKWLNDEKTICSVQCLTQQVKAKSVLYLWDWLQSHKYEADFVGGFLHWVATVHYIYILLHLFTFCFHTYVNVKVYAF